MIITSVNYRNIGGRNQQCPMINTNYNGKLKLNLLTKLSHVLRTSINLSSQISGLKQRN